MSAADIDITGEKSVADRWILSRLNETVAKVTELFDRFEFGEAGRQLYNFIWDDFCDWYIEMSKETLYGDASPAQATNKSILVYTLDQILRLLHPIMPFVTEEIWSKLPHVGTSLVVAEYPVVHPEFADQTAEKGMASLIELIRAVRNIRSEVNTPLSKPITLLIQTSDEVIDRFLIENQSYIERFCNPEELVISPDVKAPDLAMSAVLTGATIYLPLAGLIDIKAEIARLEKELTKWQKEVDRVQGKLANERFVANAPAELVDQERAKEKDYLEKHKAVAERIEQLQSI